jgi:hypothetical protein
VARDLYTLGTQVREEVGHNNFSTVVMSGYRRYRQFWRTAAERRRLICSKQPAAGDKKDERISGPHGYRAGDRVRVQGLVSKPEYNGALGNVDSLLDLFGMGRIVVMLDSGKELSLKAENLERSCFCSAAFGKAALMLCPTCEEVLLCAACKTRHRCEDNTGDIGISCQSMPDRTVVVKSVVAKSPAALAGIQVGDIMISIDGVSMRDEAGPLTGPVGSNVTLTLGRPKLHTTTGYKYKDGQLYVAAEMTNFTVSIRRGRAPKSTGAVCAALAGMPGITINGLVSQDKDTCVYEVEKCLGSADGEESETAKGLLICEDTGQGMVPTKFLFNQPVFGNPVVERGGRTPGTNVVSTVTCSIKSSAPADLKEAEEEVDAALTELKACIDIHNRCTDRNVWKPMGTMAKRIKDVVGRVENVMSTCTFDEQHDDALTRTPDNSV